jgi:hypothetical protein
MPAGLITLLLQTFLAALHSSGWLDYSVADVSAALLSKIRMKSH